MLPKRLGGLVAGLLVGALLGQSCLGIVLPRTRSAPAFIWGPADLIVPGIDGESSRVAYEVLPASLVSIELLGQLFAPNAASAVAQRFFNLSALQSAVPDAIVFIAGGQLQSEDLASASKSALLRPLQTALRTASSALSLPFMTQTAAGGLPSEVLDTLRSQQALDKLLVVGPCGTGAAEGKAVTLEGLPAALAAKEHGALSVILACPMEGADLSQELEMLTQLDSTLQATGLASVFVYANTPAEEVAAGGRARSLLQAPYEAAPSGTMVCTPKCRMQVLALQALILLLTLSAALLSGFCLLHSLDTPTRFEAPKETRHE